MCVGFESSGFFYRKVNVKTCGCRGDSCGWKWNRVRMSAYDPAWSLSMRTRILITRSKSDTFNKQIMARELEWIDANEFNWRTARCKCTTEKRLVFISCNQNYLYPHNEHREQLKLKHVLGGERLHGLQR